MWTKKAVMVLGMGVIVLFVGLIFRNLPLLVISIASFAYLAISLFANLHTKIDPERFISNEKIFENGTIKAELLLQNKSLKSGFMEVRDKISSNLDIKRGTNYTMLSLKPNESTRLRYSVKAPIKGVYSFGPVEMRYHDPFYLFYKELRVDFESRLTVYPQTRDIKELRIKSKQPKIYPGDMKVKMPGPGGEFYSIREYIPGDPFKDINWKAYASTGKLLVNEHEKESVSDITIVFDARECSGFGMPSDNPNLYGARAAATLTNFFLKRRDTVQLVIYSDKVQTIRKGSGDKQLFEILTALAGAEPKGDIPLNGIVDHAINYMPRRSPVIIVSSLDEDDSLRKAISTMCVLDFDVTILSPNSLMFEQMAREATLGETETPISFDVLKLERDILMGELRGYGVKVVDWKPNQPLSQVLLEARNY